MTVRRKLWFVLLAAVPNALVGVGLGLYAAFDGPSEDLGTLPWLAGCAWLLATAALWWLLVIRKGQPAALRGAMAGGLAGILAHPLTHLLLWLGPFRSTFPVQTGQGLQGFWDLLSGLSVLSGFSLIIFGRFSLPAGVIIGFCAGWIQRQSLWASGISLPKDSTPQRVD